MFDQKDAGQTCPAAKLQTYDTVEGSGKIGKGGGDEFDRYPYLGGAPKFPGPRKKPAKPQGQKKR